MKTKKYILASLLLIILSTILMTSCAKTIEKTTTTRITTTTTIPITTTTTTSTTTTSSTTTTTFNIPKNGELCGILYKENLNTICGSNDIEYYIISTRKEECTLTAESHEDDVLYINIKNYEISPFRGIDHTRLPILSLKSNLGFNETGEISGRTFLNKMNKVFFVRGDYLIEISTWPQNRLLTCTSEDTLDIAKKVDANIVSAS